VNVCTVEDPIEMVEPSFNQMQVQPGIDLSFADGVRALMRQDPDIIMVGEIRDLETAEMAIQAALTGHLVLSTLHTNDAPSSVMRLLELGVPYYLLGDVERHHGPAPGAHPVPALQEPGRRTVGRGLGQHGRRLEDPEAGHRLPPGRLPGMPPDGLSRPHRHLRTGRR
jgi:hypothetical protein